MILTIPYSFSPNTLAYSAQVNANFAAAAAAVNDIDNTNVGAAGFFASQIIPLTTGEATFGGSQAYTFPTSVSAPALTLAPNGNKINVPRLVASNGGGVGSQSVLCFGSTAVNYGSSAQFGIAEVVLPTEVAIQEGLQIYAVLTSSTTNGQFCSTTGPTASACSFVVQIISPSFTNFTIMVSMANGGVPTTNQIVTVAWFVVGG